MHTHGCPWDERTTEAVSYNEDSSDALHVLKWLRSKGCPFGDRVCSHAAMTGNFRMLRWAIEQGCPWREEELCPYAACGGTLEMIQWLRSQDVPWGTGSYEDELEDVCTEAAIRGNWIF